MDNPFMNEEKGKGILAAEFLIKKGIDVMIVKKVLNGKTLYFRHFVDGDIVLTSEKEKAFDYNDNARGRAFAEEVAETIEGEME